MNKYDWKWIHFIPLFGFYMISEIDREHLSNLDGTYRDRDSLIFGLLCLETLILAVPLLIWGIG